MKAYGVKRKDKGCCPGHDKYPQERYNTTTTDQRKRAQKSRKTRERMSIRAKIKRFLERL